MLMVLAMYPIAFIMKGCSQLHHTTLNATKPCDAGHGLPYAYDSHDVQNGLAARVSDTCLFALQRSGMAAAMVWMGNVKSNNYYTTYKRKYKFRNRRKNRRERNIFMLHA